VQQLCRGGSRNVQPQQQCLNRTASFPAVVAGSNMEFIVCSKCGCAAIRMHVLSTLVLLQSIQNADDARAGRIAFCLDHRQHRTGESAIHCFRSAMVTEGCRLACCYSHAGDEEMNSLIVERPLRQTPCLVCIAYRCTIGRHHGTFPRPSPPGVWPAGTEVRSTHASQPQAHGTLSAACARGGYSCPAVCCAGWRVSSCCLHTSTPSSCNVPGNVNASKATALSCTQPSMCMRQRHAYA
jgi:hypothetical protein